MAGTEESSLEEKASLDRMVEYIINQNFIYHLLINVYNRNCKCMVSLVIPGKLLCSPDLLRIVETLSS
jgi:hypothetical protein